MDLTEKLLLTIVGGLILWPIKGIIDHEIKRKRLKVAILTEIAYLLRAIKEMKQFFEGDFGNTLKVQEEVKYSADFTPEEPDVYRVHAPTLTSYLSGDDLGRVIKFYRSAKEFDILCIGFFRDLNEWKKQKHKLDLEDVTYIHKKMARILSIANILTSKEIVAIGDLPNDYKGELPPETIIR